jgi:hypothetical protein
MCCCRHVEQCMCHKTQHQPGTANARHCTALLLQLTRASKTASCVVYCSHICTWGTTSDSCSSAERLWTGRACRCVCSTPCNCYRCGTPLKLSHLWLPYLLILNCQVAHFGWATPWHAPAVAGHRPPELGTSQIRMQYC